MRSKQIDNDLYIVIWNEKYYEVNAFTKELLETFDLTQKLDELKKKLNLPYKKIKELYNYLLNEMDEAEYCDNIQLDFPLKVQWRINNRCNLKCKHCYLGELKDLQLSDEFLFNIAQMLINSSVMEVTLTGGEALLVDILPDIVNQFVTNGIKVNIYTNGILLKNYLNKIEGFNLDKRYIGFLISIDGMEKTHESIRGAGTFSNTIDNISYAIKQGFQVTTNTVLNNINYKEVPLVFSLLCSIGVRKIQISNVVEKGRASGLSLTSAQQEEFLAEIKKAIGSLGTMDSLLYAKMPDEECRSKVYLISKDEEEFIEYENWKCSAGIGKVTIDANGDVLCCPFISESKLGNILENDLKTIWGGTKRFAFLKKLAEKNNGSRICLAMKEGKMQ